MVKIVVVGARGGVGTSTVAAIMARNISAQENKIVKLTQLYDDDMSDLLGLPRQSDFYFDGGDIVGPHSTPNVEVVDRGKLRDTIGRGFKEADRTVVVARNDYLSLRALMEFANFLPKNLSVMLVAEPHRALTVQDVEACLRPSIATINSVSWDPAVARAIDAGLLLARPPKSLKDLL